MTLISRRPLPDGALHRSGLNLRWEAHSATRPNLRADTGAVAPHAVFIVSYRRPVPESVAELSKLVDKIEAELGAGKNVVLHCRRGVVRARLVAGCLLPEFLEPLGLTANELAIELRVPANRIHGNTKGRRAITADTALRLSQYLGNSPEFWLKLQHNYELDRAKRGKLAEIRRTIPRRPPAVHGRTAQTQAYSERSILQAIRRRA